MTSILERLQSAIADRYVIQREVGRGGMANVYLAHDVRHDRAVAVKVLRPELGVLLGAERFLREIRVVARLQHPHILPVHDSGEAEGALFYVMPYVEGDSLRERLRRERQLPVGEAVRIACEVAGALDLAHRRGVVHRDIKPGNILFVDGHAVVADFGIARAVHAAGGEMWETITDSGVALGTPAYMSPEQAVGSATLDARADIYSLGCVLHEMLVGAPPFVGPSGELLVARRFTDDPPRVSTVRPDVPPELDDVVAKALARLPADRFAHARELIDALTTPTPTLGVRVDSSGSTPAPRVSRPVALAVASVMIAASAMFVWLAGRSGTDAPTSSADTSTAVAPSVATATTPAAPSITGQPPTPGAGARDSGGAPAAGAGAAAGRPSGAAPARPVPVDPAAPRQSPSAAAETARLDSVFRALAATARDARTRAVQAGASAADLARGDSLLSDARVMAARRRWSDAMRGVSLVTSSWMEAERVAAARRAADSVVARAPVTQTPPSANAPSPAANPPRPSPPAGEPAAPAGQPPNAPAPRETSAAPVTDPRTEIAAVLARYARALESRRVADLQSAYPGLTAEQRQSWEQFFRNVQDMQASLTIAGLDVSGNSADARVTGRYQYTTVSSRRAESQIVAFRASFRRDGGAWRLVAISQ